MKLIARLLSLILQQANIYTVGVTAKIGLLHLKSVPPGWGLTFSSYPLRLAKIAFTPEDFHKIWVHPWRIGSYPWRIWVYPLRILWKLRLHPQRMPYFLTLTPKKSSIFITYPGEFHGSSTGGGGGADIKWNSPLWILCINYRECQFGGELNTNCNHSANYFRSLDLDRQKYIFTIIFKVIISSLS